MTDDSILRIQFLSPIVPLNGGLFVSSGTGKHDHRTIDSFELIFVRKGTLDLFEENTEFQLKEGQTLILWPGRLHGGLKPFPKGLSFYWIHFNVTNQADHGLDNHVEIPRVMSVCNPDRLTEFFHRYLDDQETGRLTSTDASLLLLLMLDEIRSSADPTLSGDEADACPVASRLESFIAEHYSQDISTSTIAAELGYNPDYLERVFRHATGYTITRAIHRRRISDAKTLLLQDYMNIEEVALSCGYKEAGYFRKVFKSLTGMTPHRFRDLHSHVHMNSH